MSSLCTPTAPLDYSAPRDARQWPRLKPGADVRDVRLRLPDDLTGHPLEVAAELVDESLGGLGLLVDDAVGIECGRTLEVVCTMPVLTESLGDFAELLPTEVAAAGLVRDVSRVAEGRWRIGLQWRDG